MTNDEADTPDDTEEQGEDTAPAVPSKTRSSGQYARVAASAGGGLATAEFEAFKEPVAPPLAYEPQAELEFELVAPKRSGEETVSPSRWLRERYELTKVLGKGGHGIVFAATDHQAKREVAVKCLHPALANNGELMVRMQREAHALAALGGLAVVRVHAVYPNEPEGPFLVMERLHGQSFRHQLKGIANQAQFLPLAHVRGLLGPVATTLSAAHEMGFIHRDLKPANIFLLQPPGPARKRVKLLDFGLVKPPGASQLTREGALLGSPAYLAPEGWSEGGANLTVRADVYSLAVVIYQSLTGSLPHQVGGFRSMRASTNPRTWGDLRMHELRPDLPRGVNEWGRRALNPRAEERFASIKEMWTALWQVLDAR